MKKSLLSLMMVCCFAFMGVAQAQNAVDGIRVQSFSGISTMMSNDKDVTDFALLTYVPDEIGDDVEIKVLGIGMGFSWGSMFPASMLAEFAGGTITAALYLDGGEAQFAGTYEVRIYVGGDSEAGTLMSSQTFEIAGTEATAGYVTIALDTPVEITGDENIWVMYYQDGSVQYPAIGMTDILNDPNDRWIFVDGMGWYDLAAVGGDGWTWMTWAFVDGVDVIGENTQEVNVYPNPTSNFVTVQANGMNHITVLNTIGQVVYDVDVDGSIQSLDMSQYGAGVYMVRVATENGVGVQRVVVK
ncbi:MAG: T9SS type A sorting domain-containing protein [Bacteroidales bacterium]|nr:T9SS type A sorting domain-containing protein [Bacteroidales bacterium]